MKKKKINKYNRTKLGKIGRQQSDKSNLQACLRAAALNENCQKEKKKTML